MPSLCGLKPQLNYSLSVWGTQGRYKRFPKLVPTTCRRSRRKRVSRHERARENAVRDVVPFRGERNMWNRPKEVVSHTFVVVIPAKDLTIPVLWHNLGHTR